MQAAFGQQRGRVRPLRGGAATGLNNGKQPVQGMLIHPFNLPAGSPECNGHRAYQVGAEAADFSASIQRVIF